MTFREDGMASDAGRLAEQARAWLVRLASGGMTAEELSAFKAWLGQSDDHERAFLEERAFWQRLSDLEPAFDRLELAEGAAAGATAAARSKRTPGWRGLGALALAACLLLAFLAPGISTALLADYSTGAEGVRSLVLPDGSRVTLNRNSAIRVRFGEAARQVELLQGEAFFEVRPDSRRPFRVRAEGGVSEAVGTAYAVRRTGDGARVAVTEGRVAVSAEGQPDATVSLQAGEGIRYASDGLRSGKFPVDGQRALAWRQGKVVLVDRPLGEALAELDRYQPGRILLLGGDRAYQPVTGVIDLEKLEEGLAALAATHGLTVVRITPFLTVLR